MAGLALKEVASKTYESQVDSNLKTVPATVFFGNFSRLRFARSWPIGGSANDAASRSNCLWIRSFDIFASLAAIIILLPVLLLVAIAVAVTSDGPVIFRQQRIGRGGIAFPCLKFRTMVVDAQARLDQLLADCPVARAEWETDQKLRNDPRITFIGRFLRKSSLDELPQLFNVLVGQMSIVGPRPIIQAEIVRYGSRFAAYCSCRPGLTGLWQVSGRNNVGYGTRVRLDAFYSKRKSIGYDLVICFRTVPAIFASRGSF